MENEFARKREKLWKMGELFSSVFHSTTYFLMEFTNFLLLFDRS